MIKLIKIDSPELELEFIKTMIEKDTEEGDVGEGDEINEKKNIIFIKKRIVLHLDILS